MTAPVGERAEATSPDDVGARSYRYPGSPPFQDTPLDRQLFKGRAEEVDAVLHTILSTDLFVLYARSGLGKSSLLNAGVVHELRARGFWPVSVRLNDPGPAPVASIRAQLVEAAAEDPAIDLVDDPDGAGLLEPESDLWDLLASIEVWRGNDLQRLVVIFDQFEELFTLAWDDRVRRELIAQFGEVMRGHRRDGGGTGRPSTATGASFDVPAPDVKVVLVIREDSLGELEALADDVPQILRSRFRLGPLDVDQAMSAISEPAMLDDDRLDSPRFRYTDDATQEILDFLRTRTDGSALHSEGVDPSQLQIVCQYVERSILPDKRPGPDGVVVIDAPDLGGREGLDRILGDFYRRTLDRLPTAQQRAALQLCERGLVNPGGRRLSIEEEQIVTTFHVSVDTLRRLVDDRLLRADPRVGSVYYELSHDTLVTPVLAFRDERRAVARRRRVQWIAAIAAVALIAIFAWWLSRDDESGPPTRRLELGVPLSGSIDATNPTALFSVQPDPEQALLVVVTPEVPVATGDDAADTAPVALNVVVEISSSTGVTRTQDQLGAGQPERVVVPPVPAGSERLRITVTSHDASAGAFEIAVEEQELVEVRPGERLAGTVDPAGALVAYRVPAGGADSLGVAVTPGDGSEAKATLDAELEIIGADNSGQRIDAGGVAEIERASLTTATGERLVVVRGYQSTVGPFRLSVSASSSTLAADGTGAGSIDVPSDVREFGVDVAKDQVVAVDVRPDPSFDAVVDVLTPAGERLTIDNGGPGDTEFGVLDGGGGRYVLSISGYEGSTGSFDVAVVPIADAGSLTIGVPATITATTAFHLDLAEEELVAITATPVSGAVVELRLVDPSGYVFAEETSTGPGMAASVLGTGSELPDVTLVVGTEGADGSVVRVEELQPIDVAVGRSTTASGPSVVELDEITAPIELVVDVPDDEIGHVVVAADSFVVVDQTSDAPGEPVHVVLTPDLGARRIAVTTSGGGPYTVALSRVPSLALPPGSPVDLDGTVLVEVEVARGDVLQFDARPLSDLPLDVELIAPDGFFLDGEFSDGPDETASVVLDGSDPGRYGVLVASQGPFTARLSEVDPSGG